MTSPAPQTERAVQRAQDVHSGEREAAREVGDHLEVQRRARVAAERGDHPNLASALVSFQAACPKVHKSQTANIPGRDGGRGYSYTYADLAGVTAVAYPALAAHGLAFVCVPRQTQGGGYELAGTIVHTSGETMEGALPLHGRDPQSMGSGITYLRRYLLCSMTGIVADDDDDAARAQDAPPTTVDRRPQAAALWAKAQESTLLEDVQAVWREAQAADLMDVEVEHLDGVREELGVALKRYGDTLAGG